MKKIKILSLMLVLLLVCLNIIPSFASFNETTTINPIQSDYSNRLNKIHFYFGTTDIYEDSRGIPFIYNMETTRKEDYSYIDDEEEIENAVKNMNAFCEKNETDEMIKVTVEFKSEYEDTPEFIAFVKEKETLKTAEDVREFRRRLNDFSKQYHQQENEKNIKILEQLEYRSMDIIDYAPFVVMDIKRTDIYTEDLIELANSNAVANISLGLEEHNEDSVSWYDALREIEAFSTVHSGLFTGQMVKVGILEASGVCDKTHTNLIDKNITIDDRENVQISDHATNVTSVVALMAPDSEYFVSANHGGGLEWFIDNGCDVVNCSFSSYTLIDNGDGTYGYVDAQYKYHIDGLYDYQIRTSFITVVVASGNVREDNTNPAYNPEGQIRSPALAYNAITVGGLKRKLGFLEYNLQHHDKACYKSTVPYTKPEVSAIYDINIPNIGNVSGTSYAAPQVTGTLALLYEYYYFALTDPVTTKAMIMATANKTENYETTFAGFDNKVGAGSLDLYEMRKSDYIGLIIRDESNSLPNSNVFTKSVELSFGEKLQASIAWYALADSLAKDHYITNYDIRLYNEDGVLICESSLDSNSNEELLRYTALSSGTYTLSVYQNGERPSEITRDYVGIVYNCTDWYEL